MAQQVLTSNLAWADAPGNVALSGRTTGLPRDSVANVSRIFAVDRAFLVERAGRLRSADLGRVLDGVEIILRG
ncbi:MAG: type II toxin-antitoxin system PemK/MazF family toxin [Candidatus Dormibacteraeota bacterium]|nr:type II toxin-antitoxin system PemK/MazF family toxin [Candidatus Dormibacteraeota bacterium]